MASKEILLMRHAKQERTDESGMWQPKAPLSDVGRTHAEWTREHLLRGQTFDHLLVSPYRRAQETSRIVVPNGNWTTDRRLAPLMPEGWDFIIETMHPTPTSLKEIEEAYSCFLEIEAEWINRNLRQIVGEMNDGEKALLVSHQPLTHFARRYFAGNIEWLNQVQATAEIYRFELLESENSRVRCVDFEHLMLPDDMRRM